MKSKVLLFSFNELLRRYYYFVGLPRKAFLKLVPEGGGNEVIVVIETDGASPIAQKFIFLCSALKGQTYKGRDLNRSFNSCELSPGPPPPPLHLVARAIVARNAMAEGRNVGDVAGISNSGCHFSILLSPAYCTSSTKFGRVIFGLQKLIELRMGKLTIKDCGLVIG